MKGRPLPQPPIQIDETDRLFIIVKDQAREMVFRVQIRPTDGESCGVDEIPLLLVQLAVEDSIGLICVRADGAKGDAVANECFFRQLFQACAEERMIHGKMPPLLKTK